MKTAERSTVTVSRSPQASPSFFHPVQTKLTVNAPGDKHEKEAESTADRVMRMPAPAADERRVQKAEAREPEKLQKAEAREPEKLQKAEAKEPERAQRAGTGAPAVTDAVQSGIRGKSGGGRPLDAATRQFMEPRFGADFGEVRVHDDAESARLSRRLGARAFTTGRNIFFGDDQYAPGTSEGRHLLAHELTHTVQQGAAIQRSPVISTTATPAVQRLGISDALNYFADKANLIPGFRILTIIVGFNPVNMATVDRSASNILRGLMEVVPGASLVTGVLEKHGVFERAGAWVEQQVGALAAIGGQIKSGVTRFLDSLGWSDIFDLGGVWERAKSIFTTPIRSLISFGASLLSGLMDLVRAAILRPLAELLRPTQGYDLLCAVLGQDPVTGDPVPRTAETLIGGFMKLIGRQDIWDNIKKGNAIARAWTWFQTALAGLMAFVTSIPGRVMDTLASITWQDVVSITGVVGKVIGLFASLAGQFFGWASGTLIELLEIIFSVVAPGVIPYVKKAQATFRLIIDNPIGFVGNLVQAARLGFQNFAGNILTHVKTALIKWITGPLGEAGVYIPKSFDLFEIIKLVLSILGLTWQNIRAKLVRIIPEPVLVALEKTAGILVTLVKDGPVAAWEQIKAELSELKSMLIAQVTQLVTGEIVKAAVTKIVSMINPAGAVIQAILAIYNTIMFFVERISQIAATVAAFVDSIAAIAAGNLGAAAAKVEQTLANTLVVVISFLARLVGLGGVPGKLVGIVNKIRKPIDKGLDRIVDWLGAMLKKLVTAAKSAASKLLNWRRKEIPVSGGGESHTLTFDGEGKATKLVLKSVPQLPSEFLDEKAKGKKVAANERTDAVSGAVKLEGNIRGLQATLAAYDAPPGGAPPAGTEAAAEANVKKLDGLMGPLRDHITRKLTDWNVKDEPIDALNILTQTSDGTLRRPGWRRSTKRALGTLPAANDRRHIVSSGDMVKHYRQRLGGKDAAGKDRKASQAKLLLEERGSAAGARTPVNDLTKASVEAAAKKRHANFFNDLKNLFVGDAKVNQETIKEALDNQKPGMIQAELDAHQRYVTRAWALDGDIDITPSVTKPIP